MFARSAFAIVLAAVAVSVHAQEPNCARNYTVVAGDFCDGISAKTSTSTYQLATVNEDKINAACSNLFVGESLCLGIRGQDCEVTHVVQAGESCQGIADSAGTTLDILFANNPNIDNPGCTLIYPGEVLCTADDVIVQLPPSSTTAVPSSSTAVATSAA